MTAGLPVPRRGMCSRKLMVPVALVSIQRPRGAIRFTDPQLTINFFQ
jgi:hypothetical protein